MPPRATGSSTPSPTPGRMPGWSSPPSRWSPSPMPGIVREALLTTAVDGRGRTLNRLRLLVHLDQAGSARPGPARGGHAGARPPRRRRRHPDPIGFRASRCRPPRPAPGPGRARSCSTTSWRRGRSATARSCVPIGRGWTSPASRSPGRSRPPRLAGARPRARAWSPTTRTTRPTGPAACSGSGSRTGRVARPRRSRSRRAAPSARRPARPAGRRRAVVRRVVQPMGFGHPGRSSSIGWR